VGTNFILSQSLPTKLISVSILLIFSLHPFEAQSSSKQHLDLKMAVFWIVAPCSLVDIYLRFRGTCCTHHQSCEYARCLLIALMMEAASTSETSEDSRFHTRRRKNLKSYLTFKFQFLPQRKFVFPLRRKLF
jgi:hypothetical protein